MDGENNRTQETEEFMDTPTPVVFGIVLLTSGVLGTLFNAYLLFVTREKRLLKYPVMVLMKVSFALFLLGGLAMILLSDGCGIT